jgi:hypothetical protein
MFRPSRILCLASDTVGIASHLRLVDGDSCSQFDSEPQLKKSGVANDFRRIQRMGFDLRCSRDCLVNLSVFEEGSMICDSDEVRNQMYHRNEKEFSVLMKSNSFLERVEDS